MKKYPQRVWITRFKKFEPGGQYVYGYRDRKYPEDLEYMSLEEHQALLAVAVEALSSITKDFRCECSFDYDGALLKNCPWCIAEYTIAELRGEK